MRQHVVRSLRVALAFAALVALAAGSPPAGAGEPMQGPPVVVEVRRDGFHWGDAAIGAAATAGLVVICGGLLLAFGRPRRP